MSEHDEALMGRIRSADAAAFEVLMRRHLRAACLVAYAHLHDCTEAEDVCQETFIRCWERIAECRDPAIADSVDADLRAVLTAEQRAKLDSMRRNSRVLLKRKTRSPGRTRVDTILDTTASRRP